LFLIIVCSEVDWLLDKVCLDWLRVCCHRYWLVCHRAVIAALHVLRCWRTHHDHHWKLIIYYECGMWLMRANCTHLWLSRQDERLAVIDSLRCYLGVLGRVVLSHGSSSLELVFEYRRYCLIIASALFLINIRWCLRHSPWVLGAGIYGRSGAIN
jgi:hypothetical protein